MSEREGGGLERRRFLASMAVLGVPLASLVPGAASRDGGDGAPRPPGDLPWASAGGSARAPGAFPSHEPDRVREVVGVSHGNLERVRELVTEQPALAKASWDWGFGDWETALGAASHTGRREIAELLIAHGARPNLFSAAMLGQVDTVRAFLIADPGLAALHGISLMRHARAGGTDAQAVVDYLLERFGPDEQPFGFPGDETLEARYGGRYRFHGDLGVEMGVGVRNGWLMVGPGTDPTARVLPVADDTFHPTGAPAVRLVFEVRDGRAEGLTVRDGPVAVRGWRVDG